MIFYRYMSHTEFNKYLNCQTIYPTDRWNCNGVCFLSEKTKVISWKDNIFYLSPIECLDFLTGIVTEEVLCQFEINKNIITPQLSTYADYNWEHSLDYDYNNSETLCTVKEYILPYYNYHNATLLSYKYLYK